jgi:hypothetical protein
LQEHIKQSAEAKSITRIIQSDNTCKNDEMDGKTEEIIRNRDNHDTIRDQEREHISRRKRRLPSRNEDFLWE